MSPASVAELFQGLQAFAALAGMIFAALAYWKGRQNAASIADNTATTNQTLEHVNGASKVLESVARAAGYQQGVIDQAGGVAPGPYPPAPAPKSE